MDAGVTIETLDRLIPLAERPRCLCYLPNQDRRLIRGSTLGSKRQPDAEAAFCDEEREVERGHQFHPLHISNDDGDNSDSRSSYRSCRCRMTYRYKKHPNVPEKTSRHMMVSIHRRDSLSPSASAPGESMSHRGTRKPALSTVNTKSAEAQQLRDFRQPLSSF